MASVVVVPAAAALFVVFFVTSPPRVATMPSTTHVSTALMRPNRLAPAIMPLAEPVDSAPRNSSSLGALHIFIDLRRARA